MKRVPFINLASADISHVLERLAYLDKDEESLMLENGENSSVVLEFEEMKDEGVDDAVRKSVLLVQQGLDEDAVCPRILHFRDF